MGKANRAPVMAAGGIVIRHGPKPLVAIVQRRKDDAWVLPKGKLKPGEKPIAAARREAMEETGAAVRVHEFLGVISYRADNGPKIVNFWRMRALGGSPGKPMDDIKAVEWLPLPAAIARLALPHEQSFLRHVGRVTHKRAVKKARAGAPAKKAYAPAVAVAAAIEETIAAAPAAATMAIEETIADVSAVGGTMTIEETIAAMPAAAEHTPALPQTASPPAPIIRSAPRWRVLSHLSQSWHSAVGRRQRPD
jgi:8-oxo-dGTP diphosphatase